VNVKPKRKSGILKNYVYEITLKVDKDKPIIFSKRYSELSNFYFRLKHEFPYIILPEFPHKDITMKYADKQHKIDRRVVQLEYFFQKMLTNSILLNTNFLEIMSNHTTQSGDGSNLFCDLKDKIFKRFEKKKM
jgi:hypothetical protein